MSVATATALALAGPAISAGGSILGGLLGGSRTSKAAGLQVSGLLGAARTQNALQAEGLSALTGVSQQQQRDISSTLAALTGVSKQQQALQSPYVSAGQQAMQGLATGLAPGGQFAQQFTPEQILAQNPGYQFALQQGQQAIQRGAAAQGTGISGGELKSLVDYSQNAALQAYQQAYQNFNTTQSLNFSRLADVASAGQTAATTAGGYLTNYANRSMQGAETQAGYLGDYAKNYLGTLLGTGANVSNLQAAIGAAQAGGKLGQTSQLGQGFGGALSQVPNFLNVFKTASSLGGGGGGGMPGTPYMGTLSPDQLYGTSQYNTADVGQFGSLPTAPGF